MYLSPHTVKPYQNICHVNNWAEAIYKAIKQKIDINTPWRLTKASVSDFAMY